MIRFIAEWMRALERNVALLAPTGRAARVIENKCDHVASTIHSMLYVFRDIREESEEGTDAWTHKNGQLILEFGLRCEQEQQQDDMYDMFIVDEASMISHISEHDLHAARFGSGNLLQDLLHYVGERKIIFIGDPCQLPPVSSDVFSAALSADYLREKFNVAVYEVELKNILRQHSGSEILELAQPLRECILTGQYRRIPRLGGSRGEQVLLVRNERELVNTYTDTLKRHGPSEAVVISNSNSSCARVNHMVREQLYPRQHELHPGELLMVVQNSYTTGLCNGDQVVVEDVLGALYRAHFRFLKVRVRALHDNRVYETLLIADLLFNSYAGLRPDEFKRLLVDFDRRMSAFKVPRKSEAYRKAMMLDPYLNALRAKFGYGITLHKAQGGEWNKVFLNLNKALYVMQGEQLYRWLYTAVTRAREQLFVTDGFWIQDYDHRQATGKSWQ